MSVTGKPGAVPAPSAAAVLNDASIAGFVGDEPFFDIETSDTVIAADAKTIVAIHKLQRQADYRAAIRGWFDAVRIGGHLIITVPHAFLHDRLLALPARWDAGQRRLYTPASLLGEIEEALAPNSYRIRHIGDIDAGYDYALAVDQPPTGRADIAVVVEKITPPAWKPALVAIETRPMTHTDRPDYSFEPDRTRVEVASKASPRRILLLKLDHMGDLIIGVGALERVRTTWPDAEITLVVGSWNADMARCLGLADRVIAFDAFPRNSTEEMVDVPGKAGLFQVAVTGRYDLAIDLRTDHDTRYLLRHVDAGIRAGIGTRAQFPFLDIFLPIDFSRNEPETAREFLFKHHHFPSQGSTDRSENRIISHHDRAERDCAIVWGPYFGLRPGNYIFEPRIDIEPGPPGLLMLDIAIDQKRAVEQYIDASPMPRLLFRVDKPGALFEFRIWTVEDKHALGLSFYGGRLIREGAASVLHQSEYGLLLLELVQLRLERTGMLAEIDSR